MRRSALLMGGALSVLMVSPGWGQELDYGQLEDIFGQSVTTSATGKPQKVSDVPVNLEIVTQDDIRRSGADNIPDALQFLTGINFRRSSFNDPELSIRGYDTPWNPRLLVLVNGQPIYEDFFGDVVWSLMPVQLDEIRQIEIIKGPNAALFGFNATSGVINIITYDPLFDSTNVVTAKTGTQSLKEGSVVATYQSPGLYGVRLSAGGMQANEFANNNQVQNGAPAYLQPQNAVVNFDSRYRLGDHTTLAINGYSGAMNRNFPADLQSEADRTWSLRGKLNASTSLGIADLDLYWTRWYFDFPYLQQAQSSTTDIRASDLFKIGTNHSFRLSAEYKYNDAYGQFFDGATDSYSIYSAGGMWAWDVTPALSVTNAIRQDYLVLGESGTLAPGSGLTANAFNHRTIDATSFNSGVVYHPTSDDTIRLMAARGFQLPSLDVLGMQLINPAGAGTYYVGNPNTRATEVSNYELDYDRVVDPLMSIVRVAAFHQTNDNLFNFLILVPNSLPANSLASGNTGNSNENGLEISLRSRQQIPFRWSAGYTFANITDHVKSSTGTVLAEPYSIFKDGTPNSIIDLGIGYSYGDWELDAKGRWQSHYQDWQQNVSTFLYVPVTNSAYFTMNARIGYKVQDHLTLALTVEQATGNVFERAGALEVERRLILSSSLRF